MQNWKTSFFQSKWRSRLVFSSTSTLSILQRGSTTSCGNNSWKTKTLFGISKLRSLQTDNVSSLMYLNKLLDAFLREDPLVSCKAPQVEAQNESVAVVWCAWGGVECFPSSYRCCRASWACSVYTSSFCIQDPKPPLPPPIPASMCVPRCAPRCLSREKKLNLKRRDREVWNTVTSVRSGTDRNMKSGVRS